MIHRFLRRFRVRHYELDAFGHLQSVNLVRYVQEAAIEASADLGFSPAWYAQRGFGWVVGRLFMRFHASAAYGDEIEAATWLSGLRGVRSIREYELTRTRDGARVARGRCDWVYVETQTGQPTRVPEEWSAALTFAIEREDLGIRLSAGQATTDPYRHVSRRRVPFHELDAVGHVNHAFYLQWSEQATRDALHNAGSLPEGCRILPLGHEIQYYSAALENENVEIVSRLTEKEARAWAWTHEIHNADTHKLLARDYLPIAFVNANHEPIAPPPALLESILRGPKGP